MSRVGRTCIYDGCIDQSLPLQSNDEAKVPSTAPSSFSSSNDPTNGLFSANISQDIDPFRHETLRRPTVDVAVTLQATKIFGSLQKVPAIATTYFDTVHHRLPIMSRKRFQQSLPALLATSSADFTALCLCLHLVQEYPAPQPGQSMQSSLYVNVKSVIGLLESTGYMSLNVIQCRVLLSFYEMGHGIYPAASMSIAACARAARSLGLHKRKSDLPDNESMRIKAEEERRVWWAIINLDR